MFAKLAFGATQYLWLLVLILASLGAGHLLLGWGSMLSHLSRPFSVLIRTVAGLGVLTMVLFGMGNMSLLNVPAVSVVLALTVAVSVGVAVGCIVRKPENVRIAQWRPIGVWLGHRWFWPMAILLASMPLLLRPLQPPHDWDELMYHLPYARFWAEQGSLAVNTWLRFPLFPYNFHLLYTVALLFGNDILPHLIHALAGWLVAGGVYFGAKRFLDQRIGVLAAIMFLVAARSGFGNANIDLGLTLFVYFSFLSLALWRERSDTSWLYLSTLFMGVAVGTKYQGLLYLPLLGVLILTRERRPLTLLKALAVLLICGGYWYLRNYLISGDPIHPLGGEYFGYWLWDRGDLQAQLWDLRQRRGLPPWYLLSAVLGLFLLRGASPVYKGLCFVAFGAGSLWAITSGYERYLWPAFPFLAIISAYSAVRLLELARMDVLWRHWYGSMGRGKIELLKLAVILLIGFKSVHDGRSYWRRIFVNAQARDAFLSGRFGSYDILRSISNDGRWRVYQYGFEGEIYLSPVFIAGDYFGRGRYRDVVDRAGDAAALAAHLRSLGLNALLVNLSSSLFKDVTFDVRLPLYFEEVRRTPSAVLYRLRDTLASEDARTGVDRDERKEQP